MMSRLELIATKVQGLVGLDQSGLIQPQRPSQWQMSSGRLSPSTSMNCGASPLICLKTKCFFQVASLTGPGGVLPGFSNQKHSERSGRGGTRVSGKTSALESVGVGSLVFEEFVAGS